MKAVEVCVHQEQPQEAPRESRLRIAGTLFLFAAAYMYFRSTIFLAPKHVDVAALNITSLGGTPLPLSALHGKAVVLNFWAPWCGPCRIETPALQKLQATHPNDLIVIGVDNDADTYAEAAIYTTSLGVTYPIVRRSTAMTSKIGATTTVPTTLYITPSGNVVHTAIGTISEAKMEAYATDAIRH